MYFWLHVRQFSLFSPNFWIPGTNHGWLAECSSNLWFVRGIQKLVKWGLHCFSCSQKSSLWFVNNQVLNHVKILDSISGKSKNFLSHSYSSHVFCTFFIQNNYETNLDWAQMSFFFTCWHPKTTALEPVEPKMCQLTFSIPECFEYKCNQKVYMIGLR